MWAGFQISSHQKFTISFPTRVVFLVQEIKTKSRTTPSEHFINFSYKQSHLDEKLISMRSERKFRFFREEIFSPFFEWNFISFLIYFAKKFLLSLDTFRERSKTKSKYVLACDELKFLVCLRRLCSTLLLAS